MTVWVFHPSSLENLPQFLLLAPSQRCWELNIVLNNEVAPLAWLLGNGHAQRGIRVRAARLGRSRLLDVELLAINGGDSSFPASQGLLEVEVDKVDNVVTFPDIQWVLFLSM